MWETCYLHQAVLGFCNGSSLRIAQAQLTRLTEQCRFRVGGGGTCCLLQFLWEVSVGLHGVHPIAEVADGAHIPACATLSVPMHARIKLSQTLGEQGKTTHLTKSGLLQSTCAAATEPSVLLAVRPASAAA